MKKIVIHLDNEVLGIALDDNASDREIQKKALKKVLEATEYQCEEVEEWPKACTLCKWYDGDIKFCLNEEIEDTNHFFDCQGWEEKERYD